MTKYFTTLLLFVLLTFTGKESFATHIMGADISYKCLGDDNYEFTLKVYRDCIGNPLAGTFTLNIRSASCNINKTLTLRPVDAGSEVSPLCLAQIINSTCNGGTLPGVQQRIYKGTIKLTENCSDYVFYWGACCRNASLASTLVYNANTTGMRVTATLNKQAAGGCDNSPEFTSLPVPYICMNQLINYNQGGFDSDGDSLVYNLVPPMNDATSYAGSTPIKYQAPWSYSYPLTTSTGTIGFDPATGQITMFPTAQMYTIMALRIDEYRKGVLIGSTMRDIQVVVLECNNMSPVISGSQFNNLTGGNQTDFNRVEVCPGSTLSFESFFADSDYNKITLSSNAITVLSGSTFTPTYFKNDSGKINITWTPTPYDTGTHVITVTVNDDACPVYGQSVYSYIVVVPKSTYAGPDASICKPATSVTLNATGGNQFTWSPATGLSTTIGKNPVASPTVTTTYYVQSELSALCKNKDTVVVFVVPPLNVKASVSPDTICSGNPAGLSANISGGSGSVASVSWTSSGSFTSNNKYATDYPSVTTSYYLTVSDNLCIQKDTAKVIVKPSPSADFSIAPANVCEKENAYIQYNGNIANTTLTWDWGGATIVVGTDPGPYQVYWNTEGNKTIKLTAKATNGCVATAQKDVTVRKKPTTQFTASPVKGCEPLSVNFQNQSAGDGLTYTWRFGDGSAKNNNKNPSHSFKAGVYDVTLVTIGSNGCTDSVTQSGLITAEALPKSDFTAAPLSVCEKDGKVTVTYPGGPAGLKFDWIWSGAKIISGSDAGPYVVVWNTSGTKKIQLKVTTSSGCFSSASKDVTVYAKPKADFVSQPSSGCDPLTVNFINNSSTATSFSWNFGDGNSSSDKSPSHTFTKGKYDVSLMVQSAEGCKDTLNKTGFISVVSQPVAAFTTDAQKGVETDLSKANFTFTNKSTGANKYQWIFGDGETTHEENPSHKYNKVGKFEVILVAFNDDCSDTFRFAPVIIVSFDDIFFPGAFSPNGDGKNEFFHEISVKGITDLTLRVYNRWGAMVFETNKVDGAWDGSYKGVAQEAGVYTYFVKARMINGTTVEKKGSVTLLR